MAHVFVSRDGKTIFLSTPYDPLLVDDIKETLDGRRWDREARRWTCPLTRENAQACKVLAKEYSLSVADELDEALEKLKRDEEAALAASSATDADLNIEGLNGELRPFQRAGVAYVVEKKKAIIADEQGLGKTVQAIAAIHHQQALPAVIIVPAIVKLNWRNEIKQWLPDAKVAVLGVGKRQAGCAPEDADWIVLNYEIAAKNLERLIRRRPKAVVCDEAQYVKNGKSARTKAVADLIKRTWPSPELVLMLTGTPIMNRPIELVSPLRMLGLLDSRFGGWRAFVERYCDAWQDRWRWHLDGASNLEELNTRLRQTCMVRREKAQVLTELPAKVRATLEVPLAKDCGYKNELKRFMEWLDGELERRGLVVDKKKKKKKLSLADKVMALMNSGENSDILARMTALRMATGVGKVPAIIEWIKDFEETGQALVVFAYHKAVQEALKQAFPKAAVIAGDSSAEARQKAVDDFQAGKKKLIICSLKAAQTGITLTAASNVLMAELDWTPSAMEQAEDRCHRIGQRDSVTVYQCVAPDGFDSDMLEILRRKRGIISKAIKGSVVDKKPEKKGGRPKLPPEEARRRLLVSKRIWANANQQKRTEYMREYRRRKREAARAGEAG